MRLPEPPSDRATVWLTFILFACLLGAFGGSVALGASLLVQIPAALVVLFFGYVFHSSLEDYRVEREKEKEEP